jgi:hypothetical protein
MKVVFGAMLVAMVSACTLAGCAREETSVQELPVVEVPEPPPKTEPTPPDYGLVIDGGFDGEGQWRTASARVAGGVASLQVTGDYTLSRLHQNLAGLQSDSRYMLSMKIRAESTPDAPVVADLIGSGYESAKRKLQAEPTEITPTFNTFEKVMPTDVPPDTVTLRVFTTSTMPIVIDDVSLKKMD